MLFTFTLVNEKHALGQDDKLQKQAPTCQMNPVTQSQMNLIHISFLSEKLSLLPCGGVESGCCCRGNSYFRL